MATQYINELENKISTLAYDSAKRKKKAKKSKIKHYFDGQVDAFELILIELKNIKFELEMHVEDVDDDEIEVEIVEESVRKPRKKKMKAPKAPKVEKPEQEALLKEAIERGVMQRKASHYFYETFPGGKIQGKVKVLEELEKEEVAQRIREQLTPQEIA